MPKKRTSETDMISGNRAIAPRRQTTPKPRAKRVTKPAAVPTVEVAPPETAAHPSQEEIARLAFLFWEARGCQGGSPEEDWLRAEKQLSQRASAATA